MYFNVPGVVQATFTILWFTAGQATASEIYTTLQDELLADNAPTTCPSTSQTEE